MPLKPQDLIVALKLVSVGSETPSYNRLAHALSISSSEVHAAVQRAIQAGLLDAQRRPNRRALLELILHGARAAFFPERGAVTRGMPTAHAAPPLSEEIVGDDLPPVWPDPEGTMRGETLQPLYRTAPSAARRDPQLYELLALVDAIRIGRARERRLAEKHLKERLAQ
jgi:DNA-binding transcriptional MocR family regulator